MQPMDRHCPVCIETQLLKRVRDGVEIDVCSSCRGVWLDRGELDKLLSRANGELSEYGVRDSEPPSSRRGHGQDQ